MRRELALLAQNSAQDSPPLFVLVGTGLVLIALSAGTLLVLGRTLPSLKALPSRVLALAIAYNGVIVGVKFALSPLGFYRTNRETEFESFLGVGGVLFAGAGTAFLMYLFALWVIYRIQKRSVLESIGDDPARRRSKLGKKAVIGIFAAIIVLSGGGLAFVAYLAFSETLQYLSFIFSSAFGALIVLMLLGATVLAGMTFKAAGEHAAAVGNAALLASLFWVGFCLLVAYHVLWVVYILVLNSVWPLRVVVPK